MREPSFLNLEAAAAGPGTGRPPTVSPTGRRLVVAIPLTELSNTLRRFSLIAGAVTLVVLATMALLSLFTVRRGLRPLEQIEQTAEAIAAGDLSRRVDETDPRTEVGRLGASLNVMLGRIEEAMDERRESEEALRRFLADASHELRTPLTSIRGYAELFRRGASDDPADTALAMRRIEQEGERMGVLVEDLLFLARAGEGRPIGNEPVDLVRVTTDAVYDARAVDPSRTIDIETPDALMVTGDEGRLRQVLANLLSNALTHTPPGTSVAVRLRATRLGRRDRGERRRTGAHGGRGHTCLRAVLPRGSRASACPAGRRTGRGERNRAGARDRRGDRRGPRRERERRESA